MRITLVVAAAENGAIGKEGKLPWHLPADLQHFKSVTMGKPILMGRKTYESISRQPGYQVDGCTCVGSLEDAIACAESFGADELMVIGGAALYAETLPMADRLLLTRVHGEFDADTFLPPFSREGWTEIARERHEADERNPVPYSFVEMVRDDRTVS